MSAAQSPAIAPTILDQAIAWSVRLHAQGGIDAEVKRALDEWCQADSRHEHAWQAIQSAQGGLQSEFQRKLQKVRGLPPSALINTLEAGERELRARRRSLGKLLGIGGVALGAGWLLSGETRLTDWRADYATDNGERRSLQLADGTLLHLNTDTAVDVRYDNSERRILLRHGDIFIETAKDPARRRFWVDTADGRLEAIGTRFLVRKMDAGTRLQVTEGAVAMYRGEHMLQLAHAGEAWVLRQGGDMQRSTAVDFDHTAWREGVLVAKQMRLADFVAELSRYRSGWLRCDPAIADLRVSGVFQLREADPSDHVLEALTASLPVRVETRTRYWTTLRPS